MPGQAIGALMREVMTPHMPRVGLGYRAALACVFSPAVLERGHSGDLKCHFAPSLSSQVQYLPVSLAPEQFPA